jgi:hypothetical protein
VKTRAINRGKVDTVFLDFISKYWDYDSGRCSAGNLHTSNRQELDCG